MPTLGKRHVTGLTDDLGARERRKAKPTFFGKDAIRPVEVTAMQSSAGTSMWNITATTAAAAAAAAFGVYSHLAQQGRDTSFSFFTGKRAQRLARYVALSVCVLFLSFLCAFVSAPLSALSIEDVCA